MTDSGPPRNNLAQRLLTAAVLVPLILYSLFLGPKWLFPSFTGIFCFLGAHELFVMVAPKHTLLRLWGMAATFLFAAQVSLFLPAEWSTPTLLLLVCGGLGLSLVRVEPIQEAGLRAGWAIGGPLYLGALLGTIALLFRRPHGGEWVFLAMIYAFWSDTAGYFVGRHLGKHPLYTAVSPKKTIEGSIGGMLGALVGGLLAHFWFLPSLPLLDAVLLSLFAAAIGQAGDLCESLLKRSMGVKDSGTLLPGHGGVLDRIDALLFTAAVVYLYTFVTGR